VRRQSVDAGGRVVLVVLVDIIEAIDVK